MRSSSAPALLCACFLAMLGSAWAASGSTTASVGKDVVLPAAPKKADQPAAKSGASGMGRRGGPTAASPQLRQELPGILNPNLLPDCVPGDAVICSDRDYTGLLDAQPTNIVGLDDNYAFAGFLPSLELSGGERGSSLKRKEAQPNSPTCCSARCPQLMGSRQACSCLPVHP